MVSPRIWVLIKNFRGKSVGEGQKILILERFFNGGINFSRGVSENFWENGKTDCLRG